MHLERDDLASPTSNRQTTETPAPARPHSVDIPLLGVRVTPMTAPALVEWIGRAQQRTVVLNHNLHSAYLHVTNERFRSLYDVADAIVIDGAPILLAASVAAGRMFGSRMRIGSTDWLAELSRIDARAGRLFVYGGASEVNVACVEELQRRLPSWSVAGVNGYVSENVATQAISRFDPDLVIIGLGMPKQEEFLLTRLEELPSAVYATVGGAIDYVAGASVLAPRWVGAVGAEWLWRLLHDPRRLAHRYLVEPALLAKALIASRRTAAREKC